MVHCSTHTCVALRYGASQIQAGRAIGDGGGGVALPAVVAEGVLTGGRVHLV